MTYTQHKLTTHQCKALARLIRAEETGKPPKPGAAGSALRALVRKGLVEEPVTIQCACGTFDTEGWCEVCQNYRRAVYATAVATDAGREALTQARREGW